MQNKKTIVVFPPLGGGKILFRALEPSVSTYASLLPTVLNHCQYDNFHTIEDFARKALTFVQNLPDYSKVDCFISSCAGCSIAIETARLLKALTGHAVQLILLDPPQFIHPYFSSRNHRELVFQTAYNIHHIERITQRTEWFQKLPIATRYATKLREAGNTYYCSNLGLDMQVVVSADRTDKFRKSLFYNHNKNKIILWVSGDNHHSMFRSDLGILEEILKKIIVCPK